MQKASIWMSALAVVALAGGCGGNSQRNDNANGTSGAAGTAGTAGIDSGRTMTLRGCVEDGVPAGTYVLRANGPAEGAGGPPAGASGSAQTSGQPAADGSRPGRVAQDAGTYRLIATGNLDFGQNLGKEVTVTGEMANQARDNTVGTTGPAGGQEKGARAAATARFLRVTSMNKVADSCDGR